MKKNSQLPIKKESYFKYSKADIEWLKRDQKLAALIDTVGPISRKIYPDVFLGMVNTVIGQQISSKVHKIIWKRYLDKFEYAEPGYIANLPNHHIKELGISMKKVGYIQHIAALFANGVLVPDELIKMEDNVLTQKLVSIPGIGPWSAEMLLIFTFQRKNVISFTDLAIQRGLIKLYNLKTLTRENFIEHTSKYTPVATIASFYLWELAASKEKLL